MDPLDHPTEAGAVAKLVKFADGNVPADIITLDDERCFVISRTDFKVEQITPANKAQVFMPKIVSGNVLLQTAPSLCDYVNRFKNDDTITFANIDKNEVVTVIDYHRQPPHGVPASVDDPKPRLLAHRATFALKFSEQWTVWTRSNDKLMSQVDFADFLEQNGLDVVEPEGADLLEVIKDLQLYSNSSLKSRVRHGGTTNLSFTKDAELSGSKDGDTEIPSMLKLRIPVYFGEGAVDIRALIRLRANDGEAQFGYKLIRPESIRQAEFQRIVNAIASITNTTTVYGAP